MVLGLTISLKHVLNLENIIQNFYFFHLGRQAVFDLRDFQYYFLEICHFMAVVSYIFSHKTLVSAHLLIKCYWCNSCIRDTL
jgi:hypothetical protein